MSQLVSRLECIKDSREFDSAVVEGLGRIGATVNDMAHVLPASKRTIAERMAEPESDFRIAFEKGRSLLNPSLRRKQVQVAMSGSVPMLIWLGKQLLGQQDRQYQQVENLGAITDTLVQVAEAAKEAGDDARVAAALDALDSRRRPGSPVCSGCTCRTIGPLPERTSSHGRSTRRQTFPSP